MSNGIVHALKFRDMEQRLCRGEPRARENHKCGALNAQLDGILDVEDLKRWIKQIEQVYFVMLRYA